MKHEAGWALMVSSQPRTTADQRETTMPQDLSDTNVFSGDDDLNPNYNWDRAIPAPGHSGVDFEKRVDFDRLHKYRLARA